jgi:hypothetical protein
MKFFWINLDAAIGLEQHVNASDFYLQALDSVGKLSYHQSNNCKEKAHELVTKSSSTSSSRGIKLKVKVNVIYTV